VWQEFGMSEGDKEPSAFKIVDKRRFTADGQARPDAPPDEVRRPVLVNAGKPLAPAGQDPRQAQNQPLQQQRPPQPAQAQGGRGPAPAQGGAPQKPRQEPQSGVDFISFIASLATNAMAAMGALPEAQARGMPVNPQVAREYIEIIAMLQERTHGNLSHEEDAALQRLLGDLKLTFMEVQQHAQRAAAAKRPPGLP
jgi:hypothetical protein